MVSRWQNQNLRSEPKKGSDYCIAALQTIQHSLQVMILVVTRESLTKLSTPILQQRICDDQNWNTYLFCFLWLNYLAILLAEFIFISATYFAQNSAGKINQGLLLEAKSIHSICCLLYLHLGANSKFSLLQVQKVAAHIQMLLVLCIMISADRCSAGGAEGWHHW